MKILFTFFLFLFSYSSQANDVQIIELHKNKSLDDLVNEEPSFKDSNKTINDIFNEDVLKINKLLYLYKLDEVCEYVATRNSKSWTPDQSNFYLKIDIFCSILNNRLSEAKLLNSILLETDYSDRFFQDLIEELMYQKNKSPIGLMHSTYNHELIPLYAAMIRIGEIYRAWSDGFLKYDELLIPIMISEGAQKEIRIKAARFAYRIGFLSKKLKDNCIEAIEQGIELYTKKANCGDPDASTKNKKKNTNKIQPLKPFNKPQY